MNKVTILLLIFLISLLVGLVLFIYLGFNKIYPNIFSTNIDDMEIEIGKFKEEINIFNQQIDQYKKSNTNFRKVEKEASILQNDFFTLSQIFSEKSKALLIENAKHKKHSIFEIKCLFSLFKQYRFCKKTFKSLKHIFNKLDKYIQVQTFYSNKMFKLKSKLNIINKNLLKSRQDKTSELDFFNNKILQIDQNIYEINSFFDNDDYFKKSKKYNKQKLIDYAWLLIEKNLVYSHGFVYFDYIDTQIPTLLKKLVKKESDANLSETSEVEINSIKTLDQNIFKTLTYLRNSLKLLDFSNDELDFQTEFFSILEQINIENIKLIAETNSIKLLNSISNDLSIIRKKISNKYKNIRINLKKLLEINQMIFYSNIEKSLEKIESFIDNDLNSLNIINKKYSAILTPFGILLELKRNLEKANEILNLEDQIENSINTYKNEKRLIIEEFETLQEKIVNFNILLNTYKIEVNEEKDQELIQSLNELHSKIALNLANENYDLYLIKDDMKELNKIYKEILNKWDVVIQSAYLSKVVIRKIGPNIINDEKLEILYNEVLKLNNRSKYLDAIELINSYIKSTYN